MSSKNRHTPERRIVTSLFTVVRAMASEIRRAGAALQLTVAQFSTLRMLDEGDLAVGELARTLRVAMPTVTQSVDSLAGKGLVERYSDEKDRRQVKLRITPEGQTLLGGCRRAVEAYVAQILSSWPERQREELAAALEEVVVLVGEAELVRVA